MTCRTNVSRDGDSYDGVSPGFTIKGGHLRGLRGEVVSGLNHAEHGEVGGHGEPLVLLGPGGDFQTRIGEGSGATIGRVVIDGGAARRGFFGVGPRSWVGLFEIPSRGVRVKNLEPGTQVEWIDIPAAVGETAGEIARKSTAYFEGLCIGIGIGMITLAVLGWLVS